MATSQNGWPVFFDAPAGALPGYISGRVRDGDVELCFDYLCDRYDKEVENIRADWSWGWAVRAVRGQTSGYSNHASATAIDINAPAHPLGVTGTFSDLEKQRVNRILNDMEDVFRWGENYSGRKDGMHFEVNEDSGFVHHIANKIRNKQLPTLKPDWKPKKALAVHFGRVQEQFLIAAGHSPGEIVRNNGVGRIQLALNVAVYNGRPVLDVDGYAGKASLEAWKKWEDSLGEYKSSGRPRIPDSHSAERLGQKVGMDFVGKWDD